MNGTYANNGDGIIKKFDPRALICHGAYEKKDLLETLERFKETWGKGDHEWSSLDSYNK